MIRYDDWSLNCFNSLLIIYLVNQSCQSSCDDLCKNFINALVYFFENILEVNDEADANQYAQHCNDLIGKPNKASNLHGLFVPFIEICSDGGTPLLIRLNCPHFAIFLEDFGHVSEGEE